MSALRSSSTGRIFLATAAAAGAFGVVSLASPSYAQKQVRDASFRKEYRTSRLKEKVVLTLAFNKLTFDL